MNEIQRLCKACGSSLTGTFKTCPSCGANQSIQGSVLRIGALASAVLAIIALSAYLLKVIEPKPSAQLIKVSHVELGVFQVENYGAKDDILESVETELPIIEKIQSNSIKQKLYKYKTTQTPIIFTGQIPVSAENSFEKSEIIELKSNSAINIIVPHLISRDHNTEAVCLKILSLPYTVIDKNDYVCAAKFKFTNSVNSRIEYPCGNPYLSNQLQRIQAYKSTCALRESVRKNLTTETDSVAREQQLQLLNSLEEQLKDFF